jgi:DNA-binding transcriptional ArsR family regulator
LLACNSCIILQLMPATVKRRTKRSVPHIIERPAAIRLLASPFRQAILDTVLVDGPLSVAELSAVFRRPPDRLYYHVKRLLAAGLLVLVPTTDGRREARFDVPGRPLFIRYAPGEAANRRAVVGVMDGMMRAARRDFIRGFRAGVEAEGPRRRLWFSRVEGTLTDAEVESLNRLLSEALALVMAARRRPDANARRHQLTWVSSPSRER